MSDPLKRLQDIQVELDATEVILAEAYRARREAIIELLQTRTQADVAALLGLSRSRLSQIVNDHG